MRSPAVGSGGRSDVGRVPFPAARKRPPLGPGTGTSGASERERNASESRGEEGGFASRRGGPLRNATRGLQKRFLIPAVTGVPLGVFRFRLDCEKLRAACQEALNGNQFPERGGENLYLP